MGLAVAGRSGRGVSILEGFGSFVGVVAEIELPGSNRMRLTRITAVVDCGIAVNPNIVRQQIEGGLVYGISAALYGKVTVRDGQIEQTNFHDHPVLRMNEMPEMEVILLDSKEAAGGVGEPGRRCWRRRSRTPSARPADPALFPPHHAHRGSTLMIVDRHIRLRRSSLRALAAVSVGMLGATSPTRKIWRPAWHPWRASRPSRTPPSDRRRCSGRSPRFSRIRAASTVIRRRGGRRKGTICTRISRRLRRIRPCRLRATLARRVIGPRIRRRQVPAFAAFPARSIGALAPLSMAWQGLTSAAFANR